MAKKTVIRRLFKYLPVSIEIQQAVVFGRIRPKHASTNATTPFLKQANTLKLTTP
ncbi:hypothetical protein [Kingella kingae]|uniref:hypothetical protein n=1 Tax=Kingella kingae TaxID=504 RepID=UPI0003FA4E46